MPLPVMLTMLYVWMAIQIQCTQAGLLAALRKGTFAFHDLCLSWLQVSAALTKPCNVRCITVVLCEIGVLHETPGCIMAAPDIA